MKPHYEVNFIVLTWPFNPHLKGAIGEQVNCLTGTLSAGAGTQGKTVNVPMSSELLNPAKPAS